MAKTLQMRRQHTAAQQINCQYLFIEEA